jgi:hypothetical protein
VSRNRERLCEAFRFLIADSSGCSSNATRTLTCSCSAYASSGGPWRASRTRTAATGQVADPGWQRAVRAEPWKRRPSARTARPCPLHAARSGAEARNLLRGPVRRPGLPSCASGAGAANLVGSREAGSDARPRTRASPGSERPLPEGEAAVRPPFGLRAVPASAASHEACPPTYNGGSRFSRDSRRSIRPTEHSPQFPAG